MLEAACDTKMECLWHKFLHIYLIVLAAQTKTQTFPFLICMRHINVNFFCAGTAYFCFHFTNMDLCD